MVIKGLLTGQQAWLSQRLAAVFMLIYGVVLASTLIWRGMPRDYMAWRDLMTLPWLWMATGLVLLAALLHAWVGMRDVILDYVKPLPIRLGALGLTGVALLACGLWGLRVLLMAVLR